VLQELLENGKSESTDLEGEHIWRIKEYNLYLNALFQYYPGVVQRPEDTDPK
jgi:hypothetical protein